MSPARIMVQPSSTSGHRPPTTGRPPTDPRFRMHNLEICAEAVLSRRPIPDRPPSTRLRPYLRAGTEWRLRSCSHTTTPRSRYWRPFQNISSIQSSCLPIQPAGELLESWRQNLTRFLLPVESV